MVDNDLPKLRSCIFHLIKEFDYQTKQLRERPLKELVSLIRSGNGLIPAFVDALFGQLRRDDCDVRLGALFIANHFFQRSHNFRLELTNSIQDFLVYTLETNPLRYPFPKPAEAAKLLKRESLSILRCWIDKFGAGYPKLEKLEHFLKNSKSIDWANSRADLMIDRERQSREQFEREVRARKVVEHVSNLYEESRGDIERLLVEAHNIIEILFPQFCPLEDQKSESSSSQNAQNNFRGFLALNDVTICIGMKGTKIERSRENVDLLEQLKDTTKQLEKWDAKMAKWLKKLTEVGDSSALMRRVIDHRRALGEDLQKCRELKGQRAEDEEDDQDSDGSDLVDVEEKEGYEPEFRGDESPPPKCAEVQLDDRPGPSGLNVHAPLKTDRKRAIDEDEDKSKDLDAKKCPPKLAMGLDLKYWGEDHIKPAERVRNQAEGHQFWRPTDSDPDNLPTEDMEVYRARQITFVGEMPAIRKRCRAPMPSGKLCPRMERERCALHGPIVDRDEMGYPVEEQKTEEMRLAKEAEAAEERQMEEEAEYLRDVEAATGAKLDDGEGPKKRETRTTKRKKTAKRKKTKRKKKTKGKKKGKKSSKTAREREKPKSVKQRERLVAKLFDKQALKRVTKTLEHMQKARAKSKFANQFNYALSDRR